MINNLLSQCILLDHSVYIDSCNLIPQLRRTYSQTYIKKCHIGQQTDRQTDRHNDCCITLTSLPTHQRSKRGLTLYSQHSLNYSAISTFLFTYLVYYTQCIWIVVMKVCESLEFALQFDKAISNTLLWSPCFHTVSQLLQKLSKMSQILGIHRKNVTLRKAFKFCNE